MAKRYPVGTIRHWSNGDVIKAHDSIKPFASGWISLHTSPGLESMGSKCDYLANQIVSYKEPIDGMKFLDHEINSYRDDSGGQVFHSDDFKAYYGMFGAGKYAFRNVFSKLFMQQAMARSEYVANSLGEANNWEKEDKLSPGEKKEIRARAQFEFKFDADPFTVADAEKLYKILEKTQVQLKEGTNFKDPKLKEAYNNFKMIVDSLPETYAKYKEKGKVKNDAIKILEDNFSDNWGILESGKELAEKKFGEYVNKYSKEIAEDLREELMKEFEISIDDSINDFYGKIFAKVRDNKRNGIDKEYGEFKDLLYIRFEKLYGKRITGNWSIDDLGSIYEIEKVISNLPKGHFITNSEVQEISCKDFEGGNKGGYAWYSGSEKLINLSSEAKRESQNAVFSSDSTGFVSVISHEIGHAVSKKLGADDYYDYKKFAVECGWTYETSEIRNGQHATGEDKDLPREGSNASLHLITNYAGKSPEEAFAEYYSFYSQHKKEIDGFIATNKDVFISKKSIIKSAFVSSKRLIKDSIRHRILDQGSEDYAHLNKIYRNVEDSLSKETKENGEHKLELISVWDTRFSNSESLNYEPSKIRAHKDRSTAGMPPIISYQDKGKRVVIDGITRVETSRMNKRMLPSITLNKELYVNLSKKMNDRQIADYMYTTYGNKTNIAQKEKSKVVKGLIYRDELVPVSIIKSNLGILKQMKKVYNSDELKKALKYLFEKEERWI